MRWALVVLLGACYSPSSYAPCNARCATDVDCPPGLACFDQLCRIASTDDCTTSDASVDVDPDRDDDGIPNDTDLCPDFSSSDNRDHDSDATGDPCDPCPHLKGPLPDLDTDGDGVGDACDPSTLPDQRVAFYGFYDVSEIAGWPRVGTWTVNAGKLRGDHLTQGGQYIDVPGNPGRDVAVTADITILALNSEEAFDRYAGVAVRRVDDANYHACHVRSLGGDIAPRYRVRNLGQLDDVAASYPIIAATHRFELRVDNALGDCLVDKNPIVRALTPVATGRVGIEAGLVNVEVDYLFIVTNPD